ncbi:MAG: antitoxin component YwqK of YwqJK toxin-antitoxin module [Dokdonia sp.]|jgi:antitoxin component YwqK of YwqJK toxin-antitoxin module
MMRNLFILICLSISFISCFYPSCDNIIGKYHNIDEDGVIHYVEINEDGSYIQYYKNDSIEKTHESTWRWIEDSYCTIELWEWYVYKATEIDDFFGEKLGSQRANTLFFVNEEDLRISPDSDRAFIRTEFIEKVQQRRAAEEAYWANKDTLYYESGAVKEVGKLNAGKKYGKWQLFHETGELEAAGVMVYDKPVFLWKYYYKNGNLKKVGTYENSGANPKIGPWEYYHENGQLKEKGIYI